MLNFDKYVNEIIEERKNHTSLDCALLKIRMRHGEVGTCLNIPCSRCREESINWLCDECKASLLQNGDGLKPGDWIMVRQDFGEEWLRVKFAFFDNYFFYAISENASFDRDTMILYRWQQARLPEEGE